MSFVQVKGATLALSGQTIFSNLSLDIEAGDKIALVGPSGAGKSSLLKMLSGIYKPVKGKISCNACRTGYVFQEPRLLPWLTVRENLFEVLKPLKIEKSEALSKITSLLEKAHIGDCHHLYPHQLSGGMAQRVSLIRAFLVEPDLLLLDEPFSALDAELKAQLTRLLERYLSASNTTMIYISHSPQDVFPMANKCLALEKQQGCQWLDISTVEARNALLASATTQWEH